MSSSNLPVIDGSVATSSGALSAPTIDPLAELPAIDAASDIVLTLQDLAVEFATRSGTFRAVDGVSLSVDRGRTVALVGESGSGKSVTALAIMRLLRAPRARIAAGEILFRGRDGRVRDLARLDERQMRAIRGNEIGLVFQEPMTSLNPVLPVGRQIAQAIRLHRRVSARAAAAEAVSLLDTVEIADAARRSLSYPHQLSGGMRQRVMIAMALACRPVLLLADEPTTALDVTVQAQILRLLRKLQREFGMGVLFITHNLGVVAELADQVEVMYGGQILESAPVHRFFDRPRHPYARALFASLPDAGQPHESGRRLTVMPGHVVDPRCPPPGCRFEPRCDLAQTDCRSGQPIAALAGPLHQVRCLRLAGLLNGSSSTGDHVAHANARSQHAADDDLGEPRVAAASPPAARDAGNQMSECANALLEVSHVSVHFPSRRGRFGAAAPIKAVDDVSFSVAPREILGLVGESGSGKSTLVRAILRLIDLTAGSVRFDGVELQGLVPRELKSVRRRMQVIFQDPYASLNPRMTAGANIAEGLVIQGGHSRRDRARVVANMLDQVGLPAAAAQRYPREFSGGQRQRIGIARALAVQPTLLLADEPVSALDMSIQAQILNLLLEQQEQRGLTLLFIGHDLSVIRHVCQRIIVLYRGRIVEAGPTETIFRQPSHPYTRALIAAAPATHPSRRAPLDAPSATAYASDAQRRC